MPTGGLLNRIRIVAAMLLLLGWIPLVFYRVFEGKNTEAVDEVLRSFLYILMVANLVVPKDFRASVAARIAVMVSVGAWVMCVWMFGSAGYREITLAWFGVVLAICVVAWLFNGGYRRWTAIESPVTRLFVATSAITVMTVVVGGAALYFLARLAGSAPGVEGNWMVTAIILYLPLMGLIAFGYDRWRKRKNDK